MAEGVFRSLTQPSHPLIQRIDSCGTGAYHVGSSPDTRTMSTLRSHGITSYTHAARQFSSERDFSAFDYILAMDRDNLAELAALRRRFVGREGARADGGVGKVMLFGEFVGEGERVEEVQDPYYGGDDGFRTAYEQSVRFGGVFLEKLGRGELS